MSSERGEAGRMSGALSAFSGGEACGARWTLGALLLAPLAAANSSYCAVPAVMLLATFITVATFTCKDLKKLAEILPPPKTSRGRRERNLRSFADFMAMWMTFLSHLVAVAICARILSATADHVTGGRTRRWLFGYETRALGEPWPDVLGVTVVMVVCAMFMCGLEESMMFTFMLLILLYIFSQFFAIFGLINFDIANINMPIPITVYEVFAAGAPISYAFNVVLPKENGTLKKNLFLMIGLPTIVLSGLCFLYTNMLKGNSIDAALPVTTLLEARAAGWVCPVLAAVTVAGICLALTELCPLLFTVLVALASPEWKVLTRSMTYESTTTGSPVLAVFTAGSLAAILAFACPLSHMITLMNASHLLGISIQAFHFIVMRCVPTPEQKEAGDIEYKRLGRDGVRKQSCASKKRGLWFIPSAIRHTKTLESIKSKVITKETEERECLLLDEYAGCPTEEVDPTSSSSGVREAVTVDVADVASDAEASEPELSSGDDSTDIDAVVKEYRDRIQVVTSVPESSAPSPPCVRGARWSAAGAVLQVIADALIAVAFCNEAIRLPMFATGIPLWLLATFLCAWQPAHNLGMRKAQSIQGPLTMLTALLFLTPLLLDSWPAITLFAAAGVVIYARCERWCGDLAVQQARSALERRKLRPVSATVPLTGARLTHIDTVYIAR
ncbi:torn and diminished rhabdomeres [Anticarsia gemmatalis]|uniref:torn and diminished rhabdomeres n=1 Tax=Anticarsia gemmatalis TaxID=129554 RepID=UPI003F7716D3